MKTNAKLIRRISLVTFSLVFVSATMFAEGDVREAYLTGTSNTAAGDYVITATEDVYHFNGDEFQVYEVYYDNPSHNMKIAIPNDEKCHSLIALSEGTWFIYHCTKEGFGVRKALFSSTALRDQYNANEYQDQTILVKTKKIDKDEALGLVAAYLPRLKG